MPGRILKYLMALAVVVVYLGLVKYACAQFGSDVSDTPHNLRKATLGSMSSLNIRDYGDVCVYCHTSKESLMWNRKMPTTSYQIYKSPTLVMNRAQSPDSTSLLCLSCHDGTMALDRLKQIPTGYVSSDGGKVTIASCLNACHTKQNPGGGIIFEGGNFGSDLRNHHPIGIIYDILKNPNFHAPSNGKVNGLPLYGPNSTQVGCASCHDPHDDSQRPFLRISNTNGALCLACHNI